MKNRIHSYNVFYFGELAVLLAGIRRVCVPLHVLFEPTEDLIPQVDFDGGYAP
jgi:hypothetical protein